MIKAHILGYPRVGANRELKVALEAFWKSAPGEEARHEAALEQTARQLRETHWQKQIDAGLAFISVNDFSCYDHVLDHTVLFGATPPRFGFAGRPLQAQDYFALARGNAEQPALEMTKWFDSN